jgi:VWFA-related protein
VRDPLRHLALHPLVSFTTDETKIQEAIERAVSQGNTASSAASDRAEAREVALLAQETRERVAATAGSGGSRGDANGSSNNETGALVAYQLALEARVRMLQAFEKLDHDQQGFATSRGLSAVVGVLGRLPGRKTIVLFSEGLSTTSTTRDRFQALAADANRANVAIYAMDVAGLRITSTTSETREELRQANVTRPLDPDHLGTILRGFERNEDLLQLNPEAGLTDLANRTGGFFVHDTNDPSEAMARIGQDMRFHYLLSYTPTNEVYDGRFRRVAVRVKRAGVQVRARDGYRASRPATTADPAAAAFAALDGPATNGRFTVHAAALSLPDPATPGLVPIIVRVPSSAVTIPGAFTLVARIRGAAGQVVAQASQHYPVTLAAAGGPHLPDDLVLYREADLPPGPYTLEAGGYDSLTRAASVVTRRFEVASAAADGTRLGSVVLVRGVSPAPKEAAGRARALQFGESALSPNLGEPMRKSESADLTFYIAALPPKEGPPPGEAIVEVRRGGQTLRRVTTPLLPPNASGRIQTAAALPLAALAAGDYELEVSVGKGAARATSSASFRVED